MSKNPSLEVRLRVLAAVDYAPGLTMRERIRAISQQSFVDQATGQTFQFTWRTIETWLCRYKKHGITTLEPKTRCDKQTQRKVRVPELAEAINSVLPSLGQNKAGLIPKSTLYRCLLERNYFTRQQIAPATFYRLIRENDLLNLQATQKLRVAFAMQHRFNLDHSRIHYLACDEFTDEVFFVEEDRKVSNVNVFSIKSNKYECPVDLRGKTIQVRYDRTRRDREPS